MIFLDRGNEIGDPLGRAWSVIPDFGILKRSLPTDYGTRLQLVSPLKVGAYI